MAKLIKQLRKENADYLVPLTANHENFYLGLKAWHDDLQSTDWKGVTYSGAASLEEGHGRHEQRQLWAIEVSQLANHPQLCLELAKWKDLKTIVVICRMRTSCTGA